MSRKKELASPGKSCFVYFFGFMFAIAAILGYESGEYKMISKNLLVSQLIIGGFFVIGLLMLFFRQYVVLSLTEQSWKSITEFFLFRYTQRGNLSDIRYISVVENQHRRSIISSFVITLHGYRNGKEFELRFGSSIIAAKAIEMAYNIEKHLHVPVHTRMNSQ
jgi:hypothetical protein